MRSNHQIATLLTIHNRSETHKTYLAPFLLFQGGNQKKGTKYNITLCTCDLPGNQFKVENGSLKEIKSSTKSLYWNQNGWVNFQCYSFFLIGTKLKPLFLSKSSKVKYNFLLQNWEVLQCKLSMLFLYLWDRNFFLQFSNNLVAFPSTFLDFMADNNPCKI